MLNHGLFDLENLHQFFPFLNSQTQNGLVPINAPSGAFALRFFATRHNGLDVGKAAFAFLKYNLGPAFLHEEGNMEHVFHAFGEALGVEDELEVRDGRPAISTDQKLTQIKVMLI